MGCKPSKALEEGRTKFRGRTVASCGLTNKTSGDMIKDTANPHREQKGARGKGPWERKGKIENARK